MSIPYWVTATAEVVWGSAGIPATRPLNLERAIRRAAIPVTVERIMALQVADIRAWLRQRGGGPPASHITDRRLRACLVAHAGRGAIFIDAADPEDEQRFSLGHELAHFLRDYWQPRERVRRRVGSSAAEVLDGARAPTDSERIRAGLAAITLMPQFHLMERTPDGHRPNEQIDAVERAADQLAFELIAPADLVLAGIGGDAAEQRQQVEARLTTEFGLPAAPACAYAAELAPLPPPPSPLLRRLLSREMS